MLNKLRQMIRRYDMLQPGDHLVCAVSGGADSIALLFAMYLLREKLHITLSAAHFNHCLRGEESNRDEDFVRQFCDRLDIPLQVGTGNVVAGKKGLEAAARDARYAFFDTLPGKIATAHTANDNAETLLMHLVRGTGLKGLGGITPVNRRVIRPMLEVTRKEVLGFLDEYHLAYVTDSSNADSCFLRNRLRKFVMPMLEKENPKLAENLSALSQRLRGDEAVLQELCNDSKFPDVPQLREMPAALRSRMIGKFLQRCGIQEPEAKQIQAVEKLIFSDKPSARLSMQNGIGISRCYDRLECVETSWVLNSQELQCPGDTILDEAEMVVSCRVAKKLTNMEDCFTVVPVGTLYVRHRLPGDVIRLPGGAKELKKLFIDKKIPASKRLQIPVIVDNLGVVGVYGIGVNRDRLSDGAGAIEICFKHAKEKEEEDTND